MKHLMNGVAIAAALALAGPVWAQGGGNSMGMPGPADRRSGPDPLQHRRRAARRDLGEPPMHRAKRPARSAKQVPPGGPALTGDVASQLNRQELERLAAGNFSNPAAPPPSAQPPGVATPRGSARSSRGGARTD